MVKGVGRMAFEDYDVEFGYSLSELGRSYSRKAYEVPEYEVRSLEQIEGMLEKREYTERAGCEEHVKYLEGMHKRLSMIALAEEREGIMNWELRELLSRVRRVFEQLSAIAGSLPLVTVYREIRVAAVGVTKPAVHSPSSKAVSTYTEPLM